MAQMKSPTPPTLPALTTLRRLTPCERDVLVQIGRCFTDRETAQLLNRSTDTVKGHVKKLHRKLGTRNRAHLAATAIVYGLARPPCPE